MTQKPIVTFLAFLGLALAAASAMLAGCQPTCDSLPTESLAQVRIVNAVSNSSLLLVYIDGKLFDSAWYDVGNKYFNSNPNHIFKGRDTYLSDGSPLHSGLHHVVAVDATTRDAVVEWDGILYNHRQSLIYLGKVNGSPEQMPRVLYLNDVLRGPATASFARFVHAVPDILGDTGSLDVYFSSTPKIIAGVAKPDIRIRFGHISTAQGGDNGTGLSANDYYQFPAQVSGILIMPVGDTVLSHAILSVPYSNSTSGILATIVIRGETQPTCADPTASTMVLEDGQQSAEGISFEVQSFAVRLVNASRYPNLSLLIKGQYDTEPRAGVPQGGGLGVLNLGPDSVGAYIPLNPIYHQDADFWFSKSNTNTDTVFHFYRIDYANERSTFIAIDKIPHNTGTPEMDSIILQDTVCSPADPTKGRIRLVNTSADYTATFSLGGINFSMKQRDVHTVDVPIGSHSFTVTDGNSNSTTVSYDLTHDQPITIFFMPSDAGHPIPYRVSTP